MSFIETIATAVPKNKLSQQTLADFAKKIFGSTFESAYWKVFESAKVQTRYFSQPIKYYLTEHSFKEKNEDAVEKICELGEIAINELCSQTSLTLAEIEQLVVVNSTALATPTLDALLIHRMKLSGDLTRTPLFGLGCVGGAVGLSRANVLAASSQNLVLLNVELCGHTFNVKDLSLKNLIATTLFGDGASAVLLRSYRSQKSQAEIVVSGSVTFPDSTNIMGWYFSELGLGLVLSRDLPGLVEAKLKPELERFLKKAKLGWKDISHFIVHPGGPKVIEAVQKSLSLDNKHLDLSWRHLANFGNLSSASVIFILKDFLEAKRAKAGELGLLFAMGPGFSAEFVVLKFL